MLTDGPRGRGHHRRPTPPTRTAARALRRGRTASVVAIVLPGRPRAPAARSPFITLGLDPAAEGSPARRRPRGGVTAVAGGDRRTRPGRRSTRRSTARGSDDPMVPFAPAIVAFFVYFFVYILTGRQLPARADRRHAGAADGDAGDARARSSPGTRSASGCSRRSRSRSCWPGRSGTIHVPAIGPLPEFAIGLGIPVGGQPAARVPGRRAARPGRGQPRHLPVDVRAHRAPDHPVHPDRAGPAVPALGRAVPGEQPARDPPAAGRDHAARRTPSTRCARSSSRGADLAVGGAPGGHPGVAGRASRSLFAFVASRTIRRDVGVSAGARAGDRTAAGRRVGRRPGSEDTRGRILAAARERVRRARVRGRDRPRRRAPRAGVDAALVHHYFGTQAAAVPRGERVPGGRRARWCRGCSPGRPSGWGSGSSGIVVELWDRPEVRPLLLGDRPVGDDRPGGRRDDAAAARRGPVPRAGPRRSTCPTPRSARRWPASSSSAW